MSSVNITKERNKPNMLVCGFTYRKPFIDYKYIWHNCTKHKQTNLYFYEIINVILHEFGIIYTLDNDNINGSLLQKARLAYIREKKVRKHVTSQDSKKVRKHVRVKSK